MSIKKPLEITDWEDNFEIAQSRRRGGRLSWVAMPTRHDSRGYRKLVRHKSGNGVNYFACWCVLVQVAARCSVRGILADDRGNALTFEDFEAMTDIPAHLFEEAIPILCTIGWVTCPDSYSATSDVAPDSEQGATTVQTVQYSTEQNKTNTVNSCLLFKHRPEADSYFRKLPQKYRKGLKKWRVAWIEVVIGENIDKDSVMSSMLNYYKSGEGQSGFFRNPATLIHDYIWEESPESWNSKAEPSEDDTEVFDRLFDKHEERLNNT